MHGTGCTSTKRANQIKSNQSSIITDPGNKQASKQTKTRQATLTNQQWQQRRDSLQHASHSCCFRLWPLPNQGSRILLLVPKEALNTITSTSTNDLLVVLVPMVVLEVLAQPCKPLRVRPAISPPGVPSIAHTTMCYRDVPVLRINRNQKQRCNACLSFGASAKTKRRIKIKINEGQGGPASRWARKSTARGARKRLRRIDIVPVLRMPETILVLILLLLAKPSPREKNARKGQVVAGREGARRAKLLLHISSSSSRHHLPTRSVPSLATGNESASTRVANGTETRSHCALHGEI
mmetsp:Transcript_19411/g.42189  ORF Transcript_19411/g.42189 Transcript_19411/m.42189 type:complete len:295 (+) Transcript_19411:345-1229(+)